MRSKDWIYIGFQPVGGLREIGFIEESDFLMVLGSGGRTVFDCLSTVKYARDRFDYYNEKWNSDTGIVEGFDEFKDINIICGGFEYKDILSKRTLDNWNTLIRNEKRYDYRNQLKDAEVLYLINSYADKEISIKVFHYGITRAFGFSPTNNSFVVAESSGIYFWKRIAPNLEKQKEEAIKLIKTKSGTNLEIIVDIATIGLSFEAYQTSTSKFLIEKLMVKDKFEGSMIRLVGSHTQLEFRVNDIKQVEIFNNTIQIDILLRDLIWRRITIKSKDPSR